MARDTDSPGARLRAWIESQDQPQKAVIADRLEISRPHLTNILNGRETPSLALAARIEDLTGGLIVCRDWSPAPTPASEADTADLPVLSAARRAR